MRAFTFSVAVLAVGCTNDSISLVRPRAAALSVATRCVAAGAVVTCAGDVGALFDGSREQGNAVVLPDAVRVIAVSPLGTHACAVDERGRVHCWGRNDAGQLGAHAENRTLAPVEVGGLEHVDALALGEATSCALTTDGEVRCWGSDAAVAADAHMPDQGAPFLVLQGAREIAAELAQTCAVLDDGGVSCWGGWLPDGSGTQHVALGPGRVVGVVDAERLLAGDSRMCAVTRADATTCWSTSRRPLR